MNGIVISVKAATYNPPPPHLEYLSPEGAVVACSLRAHVNEDGLLTFPTEFIDGARRFRLVTIGPFPDPPYPPTLSIGHAATPLA